MPSIFKALATTLAWVLWVCSLIMGFSVLAMGIIGKDLYNADKTMPMVYPAAFAAAVFMAIAAVVTMLLRKKME
jgi:hypothetical protein